MKSTSRHSIIDSLLEHKSQYNSTEYIGNNSFNTEHTQSLVNQIASLPSCFHVKHLLMSLIGDPGLHWRLSPKILPSLYWYYRSLAPDKTTISKVNNIGVGISSDFGLSLDRGLLYLQSSPQLPSDITSPLFLASLALMPFNSICSLWSNRLESEITFLRSYYSNLFNDQPAFFPSPYFNIYDFSVKRLLPSWGASMPQDTDALGPFLVSVILSSRKLTIRNSSAKLAPFVLSSTISNLVNFR